MFATVLRQSHQSGKNVPGDFLLWRGKTPIDRFDRVLVFNRLSYEVQIDVGRLHLEWEIEAQKRRGHLVSGWDNEALKAIVRNGYSEKQGARRMCNTAREAVQEAIRDALLSGKKAYGQLDYNGQSKTFFLDGQS